MWGRNKKREEPLRLTGDRLTKILGLETKELEGDLPLDDGESIRIIERSAARTGEPASELSAGNVSSRPALLDVPAPPLVESITGNSDSWEMPEVTPFNLVPEKVAKPASLDQSVVESRSELAELDVMSGAIRSVAEVLTQKTNEALKGPLKPLGQHAAGETASEASAPQYAGTPEKLHHIAENELAELSKKSERLLEERARLFEEKLLAIVDRTLSQSEANVHRTVSRLETCFAQAKEIQSSMGESLASLSRQAIETVHTQTKTLEQDLSEIAGLIESQVTAGLEPVTGRIQECRAQAEEIDATLQASLTRVKQETAETVLAQSQLFEEKIATISEQAVSQAQSSLESRMGQLREAAVHSLENQIRSLSEHLQRSHLESLQTRMDETFEGSKAKVQAIQQEFSNFSTDLLNQMRTESEAIARNFHKRLQSDAQSVATNMVGTMRGKLQKLADEFSKMFDGAFA